jgi:hypothetical protein
MDFWIECKSWGNTSHNCDTQTGKASITTQWNISTTQLNLSCIFYVHAFLINTPASAGPEKFLYISPRTHSHSIESESL